VECQNARKRARFCKTLDRIKGRNEEETSAVNLDGFKKVAPLMLSCSKYLVALVTLMAAAPALADLQPPPTHTLIPVCNLFQPKSDGSWSPKSPVTMNGPNGQVSMLPGISFRPGTLLLGQLDLGAMLDRQCRGEEAQS
jgi:hypothetical protein